MPKPAPTVKSSLSDEAIDCGTLLRYGRMVQLRRMRAIAKAMKTTPAADAAQTRLTTELNELCGSALSGLDRASKNLLSPDGPAEAPSDMDSVMDELMKGRKPM